MIIDGLNKLFILEAADGNVLDVVDLYSRWKDWLTLSDNSKWLPAFSPVGGDDIDPVSGTRVPLYAFLLNGWRIRPREASHTLSVVGGVILVSGGGDPFVSTIGAFTVRINFQQPVQAITLAVGSGLSAAQDLKLDELYKLQGLDSQAPLSVSSIARTVGTISQTIQESGGTVTVTRT